MKFIVIDTNLIFSALIPQSSKIRDIILSEEIKLYAPNYLISEIYKHKEKLIKYSKLDQSEFDFLFNGIIERINFVPNELIAIDSRQMAYKYCKNIDKNDIPFVALSIDLNVALWTGDKKLKEGLINLGYPNLHII